MANLSSGVASTVFIGLLCVCCLALLWVFAEQPPMDGLRAEGEQTEGWLARAGCFSRRALRSGLRYASLGIAVVSLALIFGAALALLGGKMIAAVR
jgi:hypothetical protein